MALSYGFYNSVGGDRTYDAIQFGQIFDGIIKDGIYATYEKAMVVIASENAGEVIIQPGRAWFNHTWSYNDANYVMAAPEPDVLLERIDALVLDVNTELAFRENSFVWVEGTASSRPERPTLTNTVTHHQYPLCYVHRYPETTMIYTRDITNAVGTSETPFVTGVLTGLDIDMWINQWDDEFHTWETNTRTQFEGWMINQQEVYTAWFNSVRTQMEDNMTEFEAWFETIQGIIDEEAATHLQAEIDALAEMLPAGSHIDIHTTESTLYNRNVTVSDQAGHSKTVKFGATGNATVESFPYVGLLDFVSTDGVRTASSSITTPYFGRYSVTMAFWAATCNIVSDESFAGLVVTVKDSLGEDKAYITLDSTGSGVYTATYPDEYTFTVTYGGRTMEVSLAVTQETTYEVELHGGFRFDIWLEAGRVSETFDTLDEVLADEPTLRQLFLVHDSVDYICNTFSESATSALADITKIFNTDLAAKWINLSDYALDHFEAVPGIKSIMDTADKYGYGEWALMPQVPTMTSATAPIGEVIASNYDGSSYPYLAFDGNDGTIWGPKAGDNTPYLGYKFISQVCINQVRYSIRNSNAGRPVRTIIVQGSNDNSNWTNLGSFDLPGGPDPIDGTVNISNTDYYLYYRIYCNEALNVQSAWWYAFKTLQFYAWAPKGNVPVMTSNTAPYGTASASTVDSSFAAYKAFDGDYATYWGATAKTNSYITYTFTNPVCVTKVKMKSRWDGTYSRVKNYKVQGSNDGSTFTDLGSYTYPNENVEHDVSVSNTNYYLYYRVYVSDNYGTASNQYISITTLQFYGRELKVSVPVMTSNTAPYGIVGCTDEEYTTTQAYKAFNGNDSDYMADSATNILPLYLYYKFTTQTIVKMARVKSQRMLTGAIVALNGDAINWTELKSITGSSSVTDVIYDIDNSAPYDTYGIKVNTTSASSGSSAILCYTLQFYGLDYSEKEFESGTTKKWLYDHGVELKEFTEHKTNSSAVIEKRSNSLYVQVGSTTSTVADAYISEDVTPYNLLRCKLGYELYSSTSDSNTARAIVGTSTTTPMNASLSNLDTYFYLTILDAAKSVYPNNISLNVSNVTGSHYIHFATANNSGAITRKGEIKELWLE